ncbi:hypothetical protein TcasGA2_TC002758 [Tribolium castaneum]|uniref:Uncharacterized protein n=1 Tax=Tribolium castaneum TaxID=7070 RepID=D6WDK5_TRICA|nr:hypothetical protein TcasGA2_TC002758 [Tribolium castaneum]
MDINCSICRYKRPVLYSPSTNRNTNICGGGVFDNCRTIEQCCDGILSFFEERGKNASQFHQRGPRAAAWGATFPIGGNRRVVKQLLMSEKPVWKIISDNWCPENGLHRMIELLKWIKSRHVGVVARIKAQWGNNVSSNTHVTRHHISYNSQDGRPVSNAKRDARVMTTPFLGRNVGLLPDHYKSCKLDRGDIARVVHEQHLVRFHDEDVSRMPRMNFMTDDDGSLIRTEKYISWADGRTDDA